MLPAENFNAGREPYSPGRVINVILMKHCNEISNGGDKLDSEGSGPGRPSHLSILIIFLNHELRNACARH